MGVISDWVMKHRASTPTVEAVVSIPPRAPRDPDPNYADPEDYECLPVLTLRPWDYGQGLDEAAAGYGFATPDRRIWAAHHCLWSTWDELGVLVINVVGETYHLDDLADPGFEPGSPVRLFPEPDNPHDPKAIAIRNWTADKTAGYVKKGSTSRLRNLLRGEDVRVMALSCRYDAAPPAGRRVSLKVAIFRPDRLLGAEHIPSHPRVFD
jgi:hypothetical protein